MSKKYTAIPWLDDVLPDVLPKGWYVLEQRDDGVAFVKEDLLVKPVANARFGALAHVAGLGVLVTGITGADGNRWIQCSVSFRQRMPNWQELHEIRRLFFGPNANLSICLPPEGLEKQMLIPNLVHMFGCLDRRSLPMPLDGLLVVGVDLGLTPDIDALFRKKAASEKVQ